MSWYDCIVPPVYDLECELDDESNDERWHDYIVAPVYDIECEPDDEQLVKPNDDEHIRIPPS